MEPFLTPEKNKTYREMVLHPKISVGGFVHHRPVSAILGRDAGKNLERSAARAGRAVPVRRGSRRADRGFFGPARQRGGGRGGELRGGRFAVGGGRQFRFGVLRFAAGAFRAAAPLPEPSRPGGAAGGGFSASFGQAGRLTEFGRRFDGGASTGRSMWLAGARWTSAP